MSLQFLFSLRLTKILFYFELFFFFREMDEEASKDVYFRKIFEPFHNEHIWSEFQMANISQR